MRSHFRNHHKLSISLRRDRWIGKISENRFYPREFLFFWGGLGGPAGATAGKMVATKVKPYNDALRAFFYIFIDAEAVRLKAEILTSLKNKSK